MFNMVDSLPKSIDSSVELSHISSYQKLLDRIQDFTWLMDIEGQIYLSNSGWQEFIGKEIFPSQPCLIWDLIQFGERIKIKNAWQTVLTKRDTWEDRLYLKDREGKYNLFTLQAEQFIEGEDRSLLICNAIPTKDIQSKALKTNFKSNLADYKRKELILFRQAEFVRRILESSKDCIKVLDLQGRLLYMNDGGQKVMEIDDFDKQLYNKPWLNFWQGCDREAAEKAFRAARNGKTGKFDGYCTTAKGTPKWWEVVVTPMWDNNKKVQEILSVSRDITGRKVAEEAVKERNRELDRFAYIVTHDLKAPLRGISNLSKMIVEDLYAQIPAENQHHLDLLQQRVLRMNALIDGLLKYARVGRQEIPLESVNLENLFQEVIDSVDPPKDFKIIYKTPLPTLSAKKILLNQVLANLISNAIKHHHCDKGQIDLTVKDKGSHYEFAIADDGPGIPESHRERIFEIFQTLENNTSTTNTGIGLALIEKIVRSEGGKFWLDSKIDKGAKFCFTWKKM